MKDLRDRIDHLARNDRVVVKGFDSPRRHLTELETLMEQLLLPLGQEYGSMTGYWLEYLRLALEAEVAAARMLAGFTSAADTPQTRIALEAIRQCSEAIRVLAYRRLECLWEVLELRKGTRENADLAEQLLDELSRCPAIH